MRFSISKMSTVNKRPAEQTICRIKFTLACCLLTGCAGVTVIPLQPDDNTKVAGAENSLRYYMPMPYLLVRVTG